MSAINPYNYIDQTTIGSNRYDSNHNRFEKKQKPLYTYKNIPSRLEIREVDVNDLVNDAFIDRLKNVTPDGVRLIDNYILNEPIDIKHSKNSVTIYRDNKQKQLSTQDKYYQERMEEIQERQNFINKIPKLDVNLPVDKRRKAVKNQKLGKIPLDLNEKQYEEALEVARRIRRIKPNLIDEINEIEKVKEKRKKSKGKGKK